MREAVIADMKAKRIKAWDGNCLITISLDESVISVMIRWNNLADRFVRVRNQPDAEKTRRRKQSTRNETSNTSQVLPGFANVFLKKRHRCFRHRRFIGDELIGGGGFTSRGESFARDRLQRATARDVDL